MDFKFTFTDGSEALMHHGIKGMKWGVWNTETAARYGGGRRIGGSPSQAAFGKSYGKTKKVIDSHYDKSNKAHRHDVELFRDAAKNDAEAAKRAAKLHPKGSTARREWEKIHSESLGEAAAMDSWLKESDKKKGKRAVQSLLDYQTTSARRASSLGLTGGTNPFLFG